MRIKYVIALMCTILTVPLYPQDNITNYLVRLNDKLGQTLAKFISSPIVNPIESFTSMPEELLSSNQFHVINNFLNALSSNETILTIFNNPVDPKSKLSPEIFPLISTLRKLFPLYMQKNMSTDKKQATLFFLHLFINTQLVTWLYAQKQFDFNKDGFVILRDPIKKLDDLRHLRNNLSLLIQEMLDEKDNQILKPKVVLVNYILSLIGPYLKPETRAKIDKPFTLFKKYINEDIVIRKISESLLNETNNNIQKLGIKEALNFASPINMQNIIQASIQEDPTVIPRKEEPLTWLGYWKKLFF